MSHMITFSGREYHFTGPTAHLQRPVCMEDIAHHLALINRFHGATSRPYSVAEHSLLVQQIAADHGESASVQLACLLHDAHEAYTNDLASPAKRAIDSEALPGETGAWQDFEAEHAHHIRQHFGLLTAFAGAGHRIRQYDLMALAAERRDLTAYLAHQHAPWACLRDGGEHPIRPPTGLKLNAPERAAAPWTHWRQAFQAACQQLTALVQQQTATLLATPTQGSTQ